MLEGPIRPKEPIVRTFRTLRRAMAPETDIRIEYLGWDKPRLAQLARAPDCRLETLGCGQPSGGPRFKSGSADQHVTVLSPKASRFPLWKIQAPLLANLATQVERDHYLHFVIKHYQL